MAKTREQKQETLTKLTDAFKNAATVVFVHFKGLTVAQESEMRRKLREDGVSYMVAKKTLIGKAVGEMGAAGAMPSMEGEVAVAYNAKGEDSTLAARLVHGFGKQFKNKLTIVGGVFQDTLRDATSMQEIATIPDMHTLRGMFANVINSPRQRFAVVLSEVAKTKN